MVCLVVALRGTVLFYYGYCVSNHYTLSKHNLDICTHLILATHAYEIAYFAMANQRYSNAETDGKLRLLSICYVHMTLAVGTMLVVSEIG